MRVGFFFAALPAIGMFAPQWNERMYYEVSSSMTHPGVPDESPGRPASRHEAGPVSVCPAANRALRYFQVANPAWAGVAPTFRPA